MHSVISLSPRIRQDKEFHYYKMSRYSFGTLQLIRTQPENLTKIKLEPL